MGKGDIKTRKGKISAGSYGVLRPRKSKESIAPVAKASAAPKEKAPKEAKPKKAAKK